MASIWGYGPQKPWPENQLTREGGCKTVPTLRIKCQGTGSPGGIRGDTYETAVDPCVRTESGLL